MVNRNEINYFVLWYKSVLLPKIAFYFSPFWHLQRRPVCSDIPSASWLVYYWSSFTPFLFILQCYDMSSFILFLLSCIAKIYYTWSLKKVLSSSLVSIQTILFFRWFTLVAPFWRNIVHVRLRVCIQCLDSADVIGVLTCEAYTLKA